MEAALIPHTVHRVWFGPHRMPEEYRETRRMWEALGYAVIDWTEADVTPINADVWDAIGAGHVNVGGGIPATGIAVQRADMISYELLWRHGGIYANCDIVPLRPLDDLLAGVECFGVVEQGAYLSNALMGCVPGHRFFAEVMEELPRRFWRMRGEPMNMVTGPHLLTDMRVKHSDDIAVVLDPAFPYTYEQMHLEGRPDLWPEGTWYVEHRWGHRHPELVRLED